MATASIRRAPSRAISVSGSSTESTWRNGTTVVVFSMAYRSFGRFWQSSQPPRYAAFSHPHHPFPRIAPRTDGVPLFVEELTKTVLESGLLREEDQRYVLDGPLPTLAIPTSLNASLLARLDRLPPSVREVAQIGAAIG